MSTCRRAATPALAVFLWTIGCTPAPDAKPAGARTEAKMPVPGTPHWSYEGAEGPAQWGALGAAFSACSSGQRQSPIDIAVTRASALPRLRAAHQPVGLHLSHHEHIADGINTGHTIQVNYDGADTLELGGDRYALVQYHFHAPSEHTVRGTRFPMEMHLVHKAADGRLAVIGVPMIEGSTNPALAPVWSHLPSQKGNEVKVQHVTVDVDELLPANLTTYRYDGSFTTPPCSEGVKWLVMTTPVSVGPEQIAAFRAVIRDNSRPTQPLNGRAVETDQVVEAP